MLMIYIAISLGILGLCAGSFIQAFVWRLRNKRNWVSERSECEFCHHKLGALDLIPVVSWLSLRGRCRYCDKPLSPSYPLVELATGALFVLSYAYWPLALNDVGLVIHFGLWLVFCTMLVGLFLYDLKWYLLPDAFTYPLIGLGLIDAILRLVWIEQATTAQAILAIVLSLAPLAGFYGLLYMVSRGKWVGLGDVKLGVFMGLVLGWQGALLTLFIANVLGTLVVLPGLLARKLTRQSRVPFGPFMIAAFVLVGLFGQAVIHAYLDGYLSLMR